MALKRLPHASVESLLRDHLIADEEQRTMDLMERLRAARRRGYLTRGELLWICGWKSPRTIGHARRNHEKQVRRATSTAMGARDEQARLEALLALHGVGVPTASAVLTMIDPRRYGVIDIRVWQLLHALRAVDGNRAGAHLTVQQWLQFLRVLRDHSARLGVSARTVERSLFAVHRAYQTGLLYGPSKPPRS